MKQTKETPATPSQPYFKGRGEHSVNELEKICEGYREYVGYLKTPATRSPSAPAELKLAECKVPILGGKQFLIFPSAMQNENGVNYIRFEDKKGKELLYYDIQEWIDEPEVVIGVIMGAIQNGADTQ